MRLPPFREGSQYATVAGILASYRSSWTVRLQLRDSAGLCVVIRTTGFPRSTPGFRALGYHDLSSIQLLGSVDCGRSIAYLVWGVKPQARP
jgi:hypothetical protein